MDISLLNPLPRSFYERSTVQVAQDLLGTIVVRTWNSQILAGIVTETESYGGPDDPASHAYTKKTERNAAMFGPVGHSYLYFIYGNHYCLNFVARAPESNAGAVLIRSLLPLHGKEYMQQLRGNVSESQLTNGPGKICQALGLTRLENFQDITYKNNVYVVPGINVTSDNFEHTARIGISKAQDRLWRFVLKKNFLLPHHLAL